MSKLLTALILVLLDLITLISIFYISEFLRTNLQFFNIPHFDFIELNNFLFVFVIIILLFTYEKIYIQRFDFWQESLKIFKVLFVSFLLVFTILALAKNNLYYSRTFIVIFFVLTFIFLPIEKRLVKKILFKFDFFKEKYCIFDNSNSAKRLQQELKSNWYLGAKSCKKDDINYNKVIVTSENKSIDELNNLIDSISNKKELYIVPYLTNINFASSYIIEYSNIRLNSVYVQNRLYIKHNIYIKNFVEKLLILIALPLLLILHICILSLIKIDSKGSIFFKQKRLGKDGKVFFVYKYRTMFEDSNKILNNYLQKHPEEIEYYKKYHKYKNDPRITKIGKFLRKTSLDELPQIINILKGEMSLVGPRPYMLEEIKDLKDNKNIILKVKPGITGLWQVSGRNDLTFEERLNLEKWYIKNWSLWMDFVILVKTIKVVIKRNGK